jgi:hypothetical protein
MLANLIKVGLLLVRMFSAGEAVEFIQFDVLSRIARDDLLVGGFGLGKGPINSSLYGRMNAFDARHGFKAQAFEPLLDGALNLLFRRFKVAEDRPETVAESLSTLTAAEDLRRIDRSATCGGCERLTAKQARHSAGAAR